MEYTKNKLNDLYHIHEYDRFLKSFDEYLVQGYGVDRSMIYFYICALVQTKKYDDACKLLKSLEKYAEKTDSYELLARLYLYCYKPIDAERMMLLKKTSIDDYSLLINSYLLQGKIEQASEIVEKILTDFPNYNNIEKIKYYKKQIENYYNKGAFIEIEYSCFIQNGNTLEPGHIVFIKDHPQSKHAIEKDSKNANRPYMIWKIQGDKVYMFPVATKCKNKRYKLYQAKYPNSIGNRIIKDNLCETTLDNILTVKDKVLEDDFKVVLDDLFHLMYFGNQKSHKQANKKFMKSYVGTPQIYDIIKFIDPGSKKRLFYLILDIKKEGYEVIEINHKNKKIIGNELELFKNKRIIYKIYKLEDCDIKSLLSQIPDLLLLKSLKGKKVTVNNCKYIVVEDANQKYICISAYYTPSYIMPVEIEKSSITSIDGEVTMEELDYIKKLINEAKGDKGYKIIKLEKKKSKK